MTDQISFIDLPEELYPLKIEAFYLDGSPAWDVEVPGPGSFAVPGQKQLKGQVQVKVTYGDGSVQWSGWIDPPGHRRSR